MWRRCDAHRELQFLAYHTCLFLVSLFFFFSNYHLRFQFQQCCYCRWCFVVFCVIKAPHLFLIYLLVVFFFLSFRQVFSCAVGHGFAFYTRQPVLPGTQGDELSYCFFSLLAHGFRWHLNVKQQPWVDFHYPTANKEEKNQSLFSLGWVFILLFSFLLFYFSIKTVCCCCRCFFLTINEIHGVSRRLFPFPLLLQLVWHDVVTSEAPVSPLPCRIRRCLDLFFSCLCNTHSDFRTT